VPDAVRNGKEERRINQRRKELLQKQIPEAGVHFDTNQPLTQDEALHIRRSMASTYRPTADGNVTKT
jgi:hypothetical protein